MDLLQINSDVYISIRSTFSNLNGDVRWIIHRDMVDSARRSFISRDHYHFDRWRQVSRVHYHFERVSAQNPRNSASFLARFWGLLYLRRPEYPSTYTFLETSYISAAIGMDNIAWYELYQVSGSFKDKIEFYFSFRPLDEWEGMHQKREKRYH